VVLRALVDIAQNQGKGPVLVRQIAARQGISKKYLDNLLVSLKNAGLVRSVRGAKGGYSLARPASRITIEDIAVVLEGPAKLVDCVADPSLCQRVSICPANDFWKSLSEVVESFMKKTTLEELARSSREKQERASQMYFL